MICDMQIGNNKCRKTRQTNKNQQNICIIVNKFVILRAEMNIMRNSSMTKGGGFSLLLTFGVWQKQG